MKKALVLVLVLGLVFGVTAVASANTVLKVGATPVPHAELLEFVKAALAAQGINLQIIEFTDYVQPNLALAEGELNANFFQHIPYLEQFSADHGLNLVSLVKTHIEPMGVYSTKVGDLKNLRKGAVVAIPNDPTNGGRALALLAKAGIIGLKDGVGIKGTVLDIVKNPLNVKVKELEAAQLPRVLPDVDIAVINTNYALEAGLVPMKDALFIEGKESPYANIVAVRAGDESNEALQKLAQALTTEKVREFIINKYGGAVVPAF